ncbi:non-structural maintenance of chromosomes element 1 homolog isoform X2 [Camellia sinensis]|uniref:non-structural maintenance of chromosomes element 1 homolog isoform X2 n=1 Tax=Camellia sinensis TaxID=4442 RepID=UPI001035A3B6|nr:non-structural maintenance of chromosomes element 1 homolog isoform X2 [Camellia sinensis]
MTSLSWRHHTLIQALLSRGPLKDQEFHSIFSGVTGKTPGTHRKLFDDYLLNINKELAVVQLELRACRNQYNGDIFYGVVNNVVDEQSKLGTKYTVPQIAFYKGIIEAIAQDATAKGSISNIDALNIRLENQVSTGVGSQSQDTPAQAPHALKNFSMSQKEKTLEELVRDQWLCSITDGNIGLGLRSFLDLRSWFRNNDIPACEVCNEAGIKAELCENEGCTVRLHQYCLKRKFSQKRGEKVCPGCGTPWLLPVSKIETVEEIDDDTNGSTQNQPPPPPSMRKRLRTSGAVVDSGTAGSESSLVPPVSTSDARRTARRSARLR